MQQRVPADRRPLCGAPHRFRGLRRHGALVGLWLFARELRRADLPAATLDAAMWGLIAGLAGAKLLWPSDLPWAVAFPQGLPPTAVPVHPTQLYEAAALGVIAWLLFQWRRGAVPDAVVLGRYLVMAGTVRFAIEFIRINERVLGPFSVAHLAAAALVAAGVVLWIGSPASALRVIRVRA